MNQLNELRSKIKNKTMDSLYMFTGEEKYMISAYEKAVIKAYLPDFSDMNLSVFEGKHITAGNIIDTAETLPFMCDKKIVIVKDSMLFVTGRKNESDTIADYFENYKNDSAILIFIESNVDKRNKAYKNLEKNGKIITFDPLSESELIIWHKGVMKKNNLYMSSGDAVYLFRMCSGDMDTILRETEKLCAYKTEGKVLREDIDSLCTKTAEAKVFDLVDAVGRKDTAKALIIYRELLYMKETPIAILAMISRQIRLILKSALLSKKGYDEKEIAKQLNERSFSIKKCLSQRRNFSLETLENAALDAISCDTRIKSGIEDGITAVETFIIKYTN